MSEQNEIVVAAQGETAIVPHDAGPSIGAILQQAVASGMAPESIEKLLAVYERMEAKQAEKMFSEAMSAFKSECPPVPRRSINAQFTTVNRDGAKVPRKFAALEDIQATIGPPLHKHGLDYGWSESRVENEMLTVHCIVKHIGGHRESSAAHVPINSKAGCSDQQKMGAAMSYAMRFSLIQALGLTTCDEDADGDSGAAQPERITEHQAANLQAFADEVVSDKPAFRTWMLKHFKTEKLSELTAPQAKMVNAALEEKRRAT